MAQRVLLYLDFENGAVTEMQSGDEVPLLNLPIGYVISNTDNSDPGTSLGYGAWSYLGSQTIGSRTVYYYERIAP